MSPVDCPGGISLANTFLTVLAPTVLALVGLVKLFKVGGDVRDVANNTNGVVEGKALLEGHAAGVADEVARLNARPRTGRSTDPQNVRGARHDINRA